ncbi:hypothetical protein HU230_0012955 [Bradyrhizobium quebecense]|uniref:aminoglycoside phosphotransferase family protein n=1 Tax=Bradyrhizobium quebecense TaxID=2748629 RepID=UPI001F2D4DB2|nr:aminoglycoside phosphotransferase family protein [Bradyrhizobium quebecense]UGA46894.1 hypothetical protein HU230_0012955 [Bradyrhizobium quebecense]
MFEPYLSAWSLVPDGDPIVTHAARLLPVRRHGEPAMLKLSNEPDERLGAIVMEWWDDDPLAEIDLQIAKLAASELDRMA